jgi:hypothetical protein
MRLPRDCVMLVAPVVGGFFTQSVSRLQFAGENFTSSVGFSDAIVRKPGPFLSQSAFELSPIALPTIPIHSGPPEG